MLLFSLLATSSIYSRAGGSFLSSLSRKWVWSGCGYGCVIALANNLYSMYIENVVRYGVVTAIVVSIVVTLSCFVQKVWPDWPVICKFCEPQQ